MVGLISAGVNPFRVHYIQDSSLCLWPLHQRVKTIRAFCSSIFLTMKYSKAFASSNASVQPLEASKKGHFHNTLPTKGENQEVLEVWHIADAVCFETDSKVCLDEGIDELAEFCGAGKDVAEWTSGLYSLTQIPSISSVSSNYSVQIQLPVQRPQQKRAKYSHKKPQKFNKYGPNVSCSISDILHLLDGLKIPVTLDLYLSFIQECTETRDPIQAVALHNHIRTSSLCPSLPIFNRLLLMYVSCHSMDYAEKLFERMSVRSVNSWAAVITGYFENSDYGEVVNMFVEMWSCNRTKSECFDLENIVVRVIVVSVLKACAKTMNLDVGKQIHGWIMKMGHGENLVLSSSLMSFYGKVGCIEDSDCVFNQLRDHKGTWTAKIISCCKEERYDEAIKVYRHMGKEGVKKNSFTFSSVLKACAKMEDSGCCGQQVHSSVIKAGLELNDHVQCGLVDMYGKCGLVKEARKVLKIYGHERNISCWNAMLTGYIQQGLGIEALKLLYEMKAAGLQPQESLLREVRFICGSS